MSAYQQGDVRALASPARFPWGSAWREACLLECGVFIQTVTLREVRSSSVPGCAGMRDNKDRTLTESHEEQMMCRSRQGPYPMNTVCIPRARKCP
ncbi:hypothetical protein CHARACLAT_008792 [Characodon lateralis]|uniref:Uncharacterized protein n=1 Tax=Characodon lateralis TaxID=208331 RepID=A0ABU7E8A9_9TELE|nr:hypothetical protein [Characodon lateralis]